MLKHSAKCDAQPETHAGVPGLCCVLGVGIGFLAGAVLQFCVTDGRYWVALTVGFAALIRGTIGKERAGEKVFAQDHDFLHKVGFLHKAARMSVGGFVRR